MAKRGKIKDEESVISAIMLFSHQISIIFNNKGKMKRISAVILTAFTVFFSTPAFAWDLSFWGPYWTQKISWLTGVISINSTEIWNNKASIQENKTVIQTNATAIQENKADIMTNAAEIEQLKERDPSYDGSADYPEVYGNGEVIGRIIDYDADVIILEFDSSFDSIKVYANGKIINQSRIYFTQPNCAGEAYAQIDFSTEEHKSFQFGPKKGRIFTCNPGKCEFSLYYFHPQEKFYYSIVINSVYDEPFGIIENGRCVNNLYPENFYYKLHPNNPSVTDIEEYPFPTPIMFEGMEELQMTQGN